MRHASIRKYVKNMFPPNRAVVRLTNRSISSNAHDIVGVESRFFHTNTVNSQNRQEYIIILFWTSSFKQTIYFIFPYSFIWIFKLDVYLFYGNLSISINHLCARRIRSARRVAGHVKFPMLSMSNSLSLRTRTITVVFH